MGLVLGVTDRSEVSPDRLKDVVRFLDDAPILPVDILNLATWASVYYQYPIGEVFRSILPGLLRRLDRARSIKAVSPRDLRNAPRQAAIISALEAHLRVGMLSGSQAIEAEQRQALIVLDKKGREQHVDLSLSEPPAGKVHWRLEPAQEEAIKAIERLGKIFSTTLLEGVTGSGKTEVYLELIGRTVHGGGQALLLIPEIGLTPQTLARFRQRLAIPVHAFHSGLTERQRLETWQMARDGQIPVIVGTRSAAFIPLKNPGVLIVDEEHDVSFKQQEGFRYSARDIIVMRGRQAGIPVVLGSATPSLESLYNAIQGRYQQVLLPTRAGGASAPSVEVVDLRGRAFRASLSDTLLVAIEDCLTRGEQCLLFINRRGFAPLVICHVCGWLAACPHCDARMVYHRAGECLRCHHCGAEQAVPKQCAACGDIDLRILGTGTQRVVKALNDRFPGVRVQRIDRDVVARKGALEAALSSVHTGETQIIIGTQMVTKGHHFPSVTLVGILDADQGLFGSDFRSMERLGQLIVQVSGRAGRSNRPGRVLIQTHHPTHPLLQVLISSGYRSFAETLLAERAEAGLPPYAALALVRAETKTRERTMAFLTEAKQRARSSAVQGVGILGPVPAPMERRAGRHRAQLLLHAQRRAPLQQLLRAWIPEVEALKSARRIRWSVDVDPQIML